MSFFLHFRLCLFCFVYTVNFFFSSERWFCFRVICVKSFELMVFNDSECDFIWFGFCFIFWKSVVLKISITLSLKNRKPTETKIHQNWLISSHFSRFRLRISQTKIFGFSWPYWYKPIETEPSTSLVWIEDIPPHLNLSAVIQVNLAFF